MSFHVSTRWGGEELEPTEARMREILAELDAEDDEHPDVYLRHESGWCLSAYGTLLIWENVNEGVDGEPQPRHMNEVSRGRVLELWLKLANGQVEEIEAEQWLPGYYDRKDTQHPQNWNDWLVS